MPGTTRRLLLVALAALAPAVAASPAGAAGHAGHHRPARRQNPNAGIVDIYTNLGYQQAEAAGTGMILTRSGEILTNNHVIRGATSFRVVDVTTHRRYAATVVGYSIAGDVAVLQLTGASLLHPIRIARAPVHRGQPIVARGNAGGLGGKPAVSRGKVTSLHRRIVARDDTGSSETLVNVIGVHARVRPGDSGGPLENAAGRVIGMVTAGSAATRTGFAIPIRHALTLARLMVAGRAGPNVHVGETGFLGVVLKDVAGGAEITDLVPGSPAADAGLVAGDVLTSLDGKSIGSSADVAQEVLSLAPGTAVSIAWTDTSGAVQSGTITPASGPPQ